MQESTLNDNRKVEELIDSSVTILSRGTPYMVITAHLSGRKIPLICIEEESGIYPLFILPTTELVASVVDDDGEPVFRLNRAN